MGLTKKVLKRPVTTVLVVLCLIVFGLSSIFSSQLELIPEMEMPMLIISAVYPGASPDDVDQLVISKIEDEIGTLSGVDSVTSEERIIMGKDFHMERGRHLYLSKTAVRILLP